MRILLVLALAAVSACSAPSEESPVDPAAVCEIPGDNGTCLQFDEAISNEAIVEGNVVSSTEEAIAVHEAQANLK